MVVLSAVASAAAQTAGNWIGAAQTWKTSKMNYKNMRQDAETIRRESREEAARIRFEADKFAKDQMMSFISSGVTGEGTPTLLTKETYTLSEKEAQSVIKAGEQEALRMDRQAKAQKHAGKAAIVSAVFGSASSGLDAYSSYKSGG